MTCLEIKPVRRARGEVTLPGDKSIAHRALLLSAITKGNTVINNFPFNDDCLATLDVLFKLGVKYKAVPKVKVIIIGKGLRGLDKPQTSLRIKESGTTFRLILGILAGQNFESRVSAGKSLSKRPMLRVTQPLRLMGAGISSRIMKSCAKRQEPRKYAEEYPPILIQGGALKGITYKLPVASAQVKSAILLAGLFTKEVTTVIEPIATRDHTERILKLFKARIKVKGDNIVINGGHELVSPGTIYIPGDISSAAFFIVLAVVLQGSHVKLRNSGLNFKRAGIIRILRRMGAKIKITNLKSRNYEPVADLDAYSSKLKAVVVDKDEIPSLIDELPILMVAACFAKGTTIFRSVSELRVKETDRILSLMKNLKKMGACIRVVKNKGVEDILVQGVGKLKGAYINSFGDHRTAMSMIIAGLCAKGKSSLEGVSSVNKSFPEFLDFVRKITK